MIAIVDSGSGNLRSVEKALAGAGGQPQITSDPDIVRRADRVVVPGQGAFPSCMRALAARGLDQAIREVIFAGRPYLGICLGFQILYWESEECEAGARRSVPGLGVLRGRVVRFDRQGGLKVPHIGWNQVKMRRDDPLLAGLADREQGQPHFYFVHSYYVEPEDENAIVLSCDYGGEFAAAVRHDQLFACQFHPEKSQAAGRALLEAFAR